MLHVNCRAKPSESGFTLIELSVVLLIVGMMLSGLFVSLGQSTESKRRTDATAQLTRLEEALYGFAQTYGRLPCPATDLTAGVESPAGGGNCLVANGFVPYITLGLQVAPSSGGYMIDPWQRPLLYSVAIHATGGNRSFTSVTGLRDLFAGGAGLSASPNLICVSDTPGCTGVVAANTIPAIIVSMGANGREFGAPGVTSSAAEQENVGATLGLMPVAADNEFVNQGYSEDNFDDMMVYLSPNLLFARLIAAGKLP